MTQTRQGMGEDMEKYEELEVEIIEFDGEDVIVTSTQGATGDSTSGGHDAGEGATQNG